jgi:murein tripeptide amidase MpaA
MSAELVRVFRRKLESDYPGEQGRRFRRDIGAQKDFRRQLGSVILQRELQPENSAVDPSFFRHAATQGRTAGDRQVRIG